jgi:hypothetical protein
MPRPAALSAIIEGKDNERIRIESGFECRA